MATMDFSKLLSQIENVAPKKKYDDEEIGYWKMTKDKAGNSSALIHFLPSKNIEDSPFVRMFNHGFKNEETGRWYIEKSLSTLGEMDYIAEVNFALYNTKLEENIEIAKKQKRKLSFISNILVIKDTVNPENDGKVFKYRYGKKIFDKLKAATCPDEALGQEAINPWDPVNGANFILKMTQVSGFPSYDGSSFNAPGPMFKGDQTKIDEVLAQCYHLPDEVAPDKFKSKEELKKKYLWVMGQDEKGSAQKSESSKEAEKELDDLKDMIQDKPVVQPKKDLKLPVMTADSSDEEDSAFFASLLE